MRSLSFGWVMLLAAVCLTVCSLALSLRQLNAGLPNEAPADLVVTNGTVYTVDAKNTVAEAVAIRDGVFAFIGDAVGAAKLIGSDTQVIDVNGATVFPGFVDAHIHPLVVAEAFGAGVAADDVSSIEDFRTRVLEFAAANPEFPVIRAIPWPDKSFLTADEVDQLFPELVDRPLVIQRLQEFLLNNTALEELQRRNKQAFLRARPRVENGVFTGVLDHALTFDLLDYWTLDEFPPINLPNGQQRTVQEHMNDVFLDYIGFASSNGLTAMDDQTGTNGVKPGQLSNGDGFGNIDIALAAREAGQLENMRLRATLNIHQDDFLNPLNGLTLFRELIEWIRRGAQESDDRFFFGQSVKLYIDGLLDAQTAAFLGAYTNAPNVFGPTFYPVDPDDFAMSQAFFAVVKLLDACGLQTNTHSIGDRANRIVIQAYEQVQQKNGRRDRRQRIEHADYVSLQDVQRVADLDIMPMLTAAVHFGNPAIDEAVGRERSARYAPARSLLDAGAPIAFVSDYFVSPLSPLLQAFVAITRLHHDGTLLGLEQAVTFEEYLHGATLGGARAMFQDHKIGSIEVGKSADLAVFNPEVPQVLMVLPKLLEILGPGEETVSVITSLLSDALPQDRRISNPRLINYFPQFPHIEGPVDLTALVADGEDNTALLVAGLAARLLNANRMTILRGKVVYTDTPPVPHDDAVSTAVDTPLLLDLTHNDTDVDAFPKIGQRHTDLLFVSEVTQPQNGSVVNLEGAVVYTPKSGFSGTDTFTYRVHDGALASDTLGQVTVSVTRTAIKLSAQENPRSCCRG